MSVNITPFERGGRIAIGLVAVIAGVSDLALSWCRFYDTK